MEEVLKWFVLFLLYIDFLHIHIDIRLYLLRFKEFISLIQIFSLMSCNGIYVPSCVLLWVTLHLHIYISKWRILAFFFLLFCRMPALFHVALSLHGISEAPERCLYWCSWSSHEFLIVSLMNGKIISLKTLYSMFKNMSDSHIGVNTF